VRLNGAI
jgi:hypothetical protein